jgi:hypothetical protein
MNAMLCSTVLVLAFPVLSAFLDGSAKSRPLRLSRSPFVAGRQNSRFSRLQSTSNGFNNLSSEEGLRSVDIKDQPKLLSVEGIRAEIHDATHRLEKKESHKREVNIPLTWLQRGSWKIRMAEYNP